MSEEDLGQLVHLLRNHSCGEMVAALKRDGFSLSRKGHKGGHFYTHHDGRIVVIHYHRRSQTFTRKTLRSILEGTRWAIDDLKRLKLLG